MCVKRISPISVSGQNCRPKQNFLQNKLHHQPAFQGKHSTAKFLGGVFGALGTIGAIGGTIIMTGGVALPIVLGYGAACAGSGAIIGHMVDKDAEKNDKDT